ncbi:UNVERIFIED_CONTAM: protein NRT1/ PTR FAMILY 8.1 [Sesamum angustifolium]|uniref:Protein NRT1/ PTR FAMILY 8.1 n=1 Tax=Sesamum angustifolium TaxID=2727405 RepID=A0AAW2MKP3_9LAMI
MLLFFAAWRLPNVQLQLLYVSVLLVALGRAGREVSLKEFLADQFRKEGSSQDEERVQSRRKVWWRSAYILGICASVYVFANTSWIKLSKISTIAMAAAFLWFLAGIGFYKRKPPTNKSRLNDAFQVMYAAISKRNLNHTPSENVIPILRCLDKASIVEPSPSPEEQIRKGRLWEVEDVQEVKRLLSMIPLWITFLVYGLLQATGNTFFYEQVNYMDTHLGRISSVPVVIFLIVKSSTSFVVSRICDLLFPYYWGEKVPRDVMLTAAEVCEPRRFHHIFLASSHNFFLLGLMEGLVFGGMQEMFYALVPESFKHYGPSFTQFSLNIGNFLSLLAILVFHGLFSDDLNTSSLGTYYALLGYVCFVNLLFYCGVATYYVKESDREKEPLLVQEAKQHLEQEIPQAVEQAQNW